MEFEEKWRYFESILCRCLVGMWYVVTKITRPRGRAKNAKWRLILFNRTTAALIDNRMLIERIISYMQDIHSLHSKSRFSWESFLPALWRTSITNKKRQSNKLPYKMAHAVPTLIIWALAPFPTIRLSNSDDGTHPSRNWNHETIDIRSFAHSQHLLSARDVELTPSSLKSFKLNHVRSPALQWHSQGTHSRRVVVNRWDECNDVCHAVDYNVCITTGSQLLRFPSVSSNVYISFRDSRER